MFYVLSWSGTGGERIGPTSGSKGAGKATGVGRVADRGRKPGPAVAALDRAFPEDLWRRWEERRRDAGSDVGEFRS